MKSETVTTVMVLMLFLSALVAVWISVRWFFSVKEVQDLQSQQMRISNTRLAAQALANDVIQHGAKNPRIESLLAEFNMRPVTNQAPANPAAK